MVVEVGEIVADVAGAVLRQAGGMVVEPFFLTNSGDLAAYDARKWLAARAVAGVLREAAV